MRWAVSRTCSSWRRCSYRLCVSWGGVLARRLIVWGSVRHSQVSTDHVNDGLPLGRVVLREAFQRVQTTEPDRGLLHAELINRPGIQLGDTPLGGILCGGSVHLALVL